MSRDICLIDCSYPYLISKDSAHTSVIVRRVQELLGGYTASILDAAALASKYAFTSSLHFGICLAGLQSAPCLLVS